MESPKAAEQDNNPTTRQTWGCTHIQSLPEQPIWYWATQEQTTCWWGIKIQDIDLTTNKERIQEHEHKKAPATQKQHGKGPQAKKLAKHPGNPWTHTTTLDQKSKVQAY